MEIFPTIILLFIFLFWISLTSRIVFINLGCLYLLVIGSLAGLCVLAIGWFGGRTYSFMGGLRAAAQMVSYEVVLSFFFFMFCRLGWIIDLYSLSSYSCRRVVGLFFFLPLWLVTIIAETNRAPFDISEGESELVSGFNTEYSRLLFTIIFLGEYGLIAGYSSLSSYFFLGNWIRGILFSVIILWVRRCFPRKRYDVLIILL